MKLVRIFEIECIYDNIIKHLSNDDFNHLKLTNKQIYKIMYNNGYLNSLYINIDNIDSLIRSHEKYDRHIRYLKSIRLSNIQQNETSMLPYFNKNLNIYINNGCDIRYNVCLKNITKLCLIDCEDLDMYELSKCQYLRYLSIYNNIERCSWITVSRICEFKNLEILFIKGDINLTKIVANKLKQIYFTSLLSIFINQYIMCLFKNLDIVFITFLDKITSINLNKNIKNIGILNKYTLYIQNDKKKDYIDIFIDNCNLKYNNIVYKVDKNIISDNINNYFIK